MKNNISLNPKLIIKQLSSASNKFKKYLALTAILIVLGIYSFLILKISTAAQQDPSLDEITAQLSSIKRLQVDQNEISKIQQLEDQNIVVQSLFESARKDPFKE